MLDQTTTLKFAAPEGMTELTMYGIVNDLGAAGGNPTLTDVLAEYENRAPHDPETKRDNRRSAANRALRSLVDKRILEARGCRIGFREGYAPPPTFEEASQALEASWRGIVSLLSADVAAMPEIKELASAIKVVSKCAWVFAHIQSGTDLAG